jgi:hypothetical protein
MAELDLSQLQLLLFLFIGATVVTAIILVVYLVVASKRQRAKDAEPETVEPPAEPMTLPPAEQELSLVREKVGDRLQIEIGGARYRRLADVEDIDVKRKIITMAMELIQFTGVLGEGALEPAPIDKTRTWREDLRQGSQVELQRARSAAAGPGSDLRPPVTLQEVEASFLNLLTEMGQMSAPLERPSLVDSIQHRLRPKPVDPSRPRTFVHDIDEIVQRRVQLIPALTGRELHVRSGPSGKVRFTFEGTEYESVDDIPNLTARQLIKDAIQEWDETT